MSRGIVKPVLQVDLTQPDPIPPQGIDRAVQLYGGRGVVKGNMAESLYREIRALRIYEGASEIQKVIIARQTYQGNTK